MHVDHGLRPGSERRGRGRRRPSPRGSGAAFRAERVAVERGPEPRGPGSAGSLRRPARPTPSPATPPTTRPRRCCSTCCAAPGSTGSRATTRTAARCARLRRRETHSSAPTSASSPSHDPSNDDPAFRRNRVRHELLPLLDAIAERDVAGVLARQADVLRVDAELLEHLSRSLDPTDAKALAAAPDAARRRGPCGAGSATGHEQHPPDAATVARVLAVARGEAVACEVGGGRQVRRHRQRLRAVLSGYLALVASEAEHQHLFDSPDLGEVVVDGREPPGPRRRAGRRDHPRLRRAGRPCSSACSRARPCS